MFFPNIVPVGFLLMITSYSFPIIEFPVLNKPVGVCPDSPEVPKPLAEVETIIVSIIFPFSRR